ncbi:MAG: MFS transporter [Beijerinckiaceae bacterium]
MSDKRPTGGRAVFRHVDYARYSFARFLWGLGLQIQTVAVAWYVYDVTSDPLALGMIGLATFIPAVPLSLVTGPAADRYDRRIIMLLCCATMAFCAAGFVALMYFGAVRAGQVWPVYIVVFVLGVARSFSNPAGQALVMSLVPDEEYPSAAAWNNSMNQTANIVGPAIGGLLFPFGIYAPFIAAGAAFVVAFALVARIAYRPQKAGKPPVTLAMLAAGYKFIWRSPIILGAITLDLVAVLLAGATALLPIFARDIFETGPWGLGLLRAMPSVGSVAAALMLAYFPLQAGIGKKMLVSVAIYGFATIGFGLSTHILMAIPFLIIIGAADMVSVVIRQTLIQVETPPEMRGRVVAVHTILTGTSNQLGEFESGALAWAIGAVPAVLVGGAGALAAAALWARIFPDLRRRETY